MEHKLLTIDISHGTTHDGPGMRTTVFVKGCPLHCRWCQNPESISGKNEVWWEQSKCIGCETCIAACPTQALFLDAEGMHIDRNKCDDCAICADVCPTAAMSLQGQAYDLTVLLEEVLKDRIYYEQFGGGVTCSGGEPLLQYPAVAEFFRNLKKENITTALDTCGCVPRKNLEAVLPWTDYVLYDLKLWDSNLHEKYTGRSNEMIQDNLLYIAEYIRKADRPMEIWIRTPLIPQATAELDNIRKIGQFIRDHILDVTARWELCAFNGACISKYEKLGQKWYYADTPTMTKAEIEAIREAALCMVPEEKLRISGIIR